MSETTIDAWPARFDHVVTEHGDCIAWCPACAHHASLGLNPDGSISEKLAASLVPLRLRAALREVAAERLRQELKWGTGSMASTGRAVSDPGHALAVLVEEVGEVSRAILEHEPGARVLAEVVQVAAVAVAWLECLIDTGCASGSGGGPDGGGPDVRATDKLDDWPLEDCPACNGTGRVDGDSSVWCATCDGHGGPVATLSCDATTAAIVSATTERADARQALRQLAESIGEPGIDADPLLCASRVNEHLELLRAERMPADDELRALCRAAAGMSPDRRRRLRELAEACAGDPESLECALHDIVADALHRSMGGVG